MSYPRWWETTITLYNRYEDSATNLVTWYRTVIPRCFFKNANNKTVIDKAVFETNNIIVRIPQSDSFREYGEWVNIPDDEKGGYFTLHQGDIIVKGEITEDINEYVKGQHSTDFLAKYKDAGACLTVSSWQDNTGVGRGSPHYYVKGE